MKKTVTITTQIQFESLKEVHKYFEKCFTCTHSATRPSEKETVFIRGILKEAIKNKPYKLTCNGYGQIKKVETPISNIDSLNLFRIFLEAIWGKMKKGEQIVFTTVSQF